MKHRSSSSAGHRRSVPRLRVVGASGRGGVRWGRGQLQPTSPACAGGARRDGQAHAVPFADDGEPPEAEHARPLGGRAGDKLPASQRRTSRRSRRRRVASATPSRWARCVRTWARNTGLHRAGPTSTTADKIGDAAKKQDADAVLKALTVTLTTCTGCHGAFTAGRGRRGVDGPTKMSAPSHPH